MIMESFIGKKYTELPSPCLIVDMEALEHNMKTMQDFADRHKVALRPHIKTHKCSRLAIGQVDAGSIGVTCAKVGEATAMAHAGIKSILIANIIVPEDKIRVICGINRYADVMPCVDSVENVRDYSRIAKEFGVTVPLFIEVDIALNRCGVRNYEEALEIAKEIDKLDNVELRGIQAYEGRGNGSKTQDDKLKYAEDTIKKALDIRKKLSEAGYQTEIFSCASTGTCTADATYEGVTEIQPGSYIYMESAYPLDEIMIPFKQAIFLLATVCSRHGDRCVCTAGEKSITFDQGLPHIVGEPDIKIELNEEHCLFDAAGSIKDIKPGDPILLCPSHCCTTVNLHDRVYCVRNGIVEDIWDIDARGRFD